METITKSGVWTILRLFYNEKNARIHLRDIARKAGLNENSASRFLEQMSKLKEFWKKPSHPLMIFILLVNKLFQR